MRAVMFLPGLLLAAAAWSCASEPAAPTEPVSGFVESATGGVGATWSREAGELVVHVRPSPGAVVSRVPEAGLVRVNGVEVPFERGAKAGQLVARVPYAGKARDLAIAIYARDSTGKTVLRYTNQLAPEDTARFEAWLRKLELDEKRRREMR
jgi:hypothetical protein